jgi:hypothetical protein
MWRISYGVLHLDCSLRRIKRLAMRETPMMKIIHKFIQSHREKESIKISSFASHKNKTICQAKNILDSCIRTAMRYKIVDSITQARLIIPGISRNTKARAKVNSEIGTAKRISSVFLLIVVRPPSIRMKYLWRVSAYIKHILAWIMYANQSIIHGNFSCPT